LKVISQSFTGSNVGPCPCPCYKKDSKEKTSS
jgi:hypothetical protein